MQLQKIVSQENQKCWGKPLGSQSLWDGHLQTIQRIQEMASHVQISEVSDYLHLPYIVIELNNLNFCFTA